MRYASNMTKNIESTARDHVSDLYSQTRYVHGVHTRKTRGIVGEDFDFFFFLIIVVHSTP